MSSFKKSNFVKEFAYRTMVNYYNFKNMHNNEEHCCDTVGELLKEMKKLGYDTSQNYEVTFAINSLIGLLIFPQQRFFYKIKKITLDELPTLKGCIKNKDDYTNEYLVEEGVKEDDTPANILRHLRNAIAHERITPISTNGETITHIEFRDKTNSELNKGKNFYLRIKANQLENLAMEIAKYIVNYKEE